MTKTFWLEKKKTYFLLLEDDAIKCAECYKVQEAGALVWVHRFWNNRKAAREYFCEKCIDKLQAKGLVDDYFIAYLTEVVPYGSEVVFDGPYPMGNGGATVISAAVSNEGISADCTGKADNDYTRLAGRPESSILGAQIGKPVKEIANQGAAKGDSTSELCSQTSSKVDFSKSPATSPICVCGHYKNAHTPTMFYPNDTSCNYCGCRKYQNMG